MTAPFRPRQKFASRLLFHPPKGGSRRPHVKDTCPQSIGICTAVEVSALRRGVVRHPARWTGAASPPRIAAPTTTYNHEAAVVSTGETLTLLGTNVAGGTSFRRPAAPGGNGASPGRRRLRRGGSVGHGSNFRQSRALPKICADLEPPRRGGIDRPDLSPLGRRCLAPSRDLSRCGLRPSPRSAQAAAGTSCGATRSLGGRRPRI